MSVKLMGAAWELDIEPNKKFVLLALSDHANDENFCAWPSLARLCTKTSLARSTVAKLLKALEEEGYITRLRRGTQTTVYELNAGDWFDTRTSPAHGLVRQSDPPSPTHGPALVRQSDGGGPTHGPRTVREPSEEPSGNHQKESRGKRATEGRRLPDEFALTDQRLEAARKQGLSDDEASEELDKFCDYWRGVPGQRGRKADWEATWRNWCRNAVKFRQQRGSGSAKRSNQNADAINRWLEQTDAIDGVVGGS